MMFPRLKSVNTRGQNTGGCKKSHAKTALVKKSTLARTGQTSNLAKEVMQLKDPFLAKCVHFERSFSWSLEWRHAGACAARWSTGCGLAPCWPGNRAQTPSREEESQTQGFAISKFEFGKKCQFFTGHFQGHWSDALRGLVIYRVLASSMMTGASCAVTVLEEWSQAQRPFTSKIDFE